MDLPTQENPTLNPHVASLIKTFELVVEEEKKTEGDAPAPKPALPGVDGLTLGERLEMRDEIAEQKKDEKPAATNAPAEPETKPDPAAPAAPTQPETPAAPKVDDQPPKPLVVKRQTTEPAAPTAPPAPVAPPTPETPAPSADDEYVKTLTDDQRDELALAKFAEANGKKGIYSATLEYFKKVDKALAEHPEWDDTHEEYQELVKANRPQWTQTERRRFERLQIVEEATANANREAQAKIHEQERQLRELKSAPAIEKSVETASRILTESNDNGMEPIPADVIKTINEKGYIAALNDFPDEAPLVQGAINATESFMRVIHGIDTYDPEKNQTHQWLETFIAAQGAQMLKQPKETQVVNGKQFMPVAEYRALLQTKPAEAAKYWTFPNDMVVDMIAANSVIQYNEKLKSLEKRGWKREKVSAKPPTNPTPEPTPTPTSDGPRASTSARLPGAGFIEKDATIELPPHLRGLVDK